MEERIGYIGVKFDGDPIPYSLNPYCNGRKNRIVSVYFHQKASLQVLILIVMEERIGYLQTESSIVISIDVLILIVMEERIG